jgi:diguanylate cyclase (GGDEF)-like protein
MFLLLVPLIGYLDLITGAEIGFSVFYLVPIMMAGWYHYDRKVSPILIPAMSAAAWLLADMYSGHRYSSQWIQFWNMSIRLIMFSIIGVALSRLRTSQVKADMLSRTDPLTGVLNSRYFNELAAKEINRLLRYSEPLSFAYFDIDNFKNINDKLGHHQGDQLLKELALIVKGNIREIDVFARFGGDEFGILFPRTDIQQSRAAIGKILSLFRDNVSEKWPVTLSAGVITYLVPPKSVDEMVRLADSLMYKAKRRGKDNVEYSIHNELT